VSTHRTPEIFSSITPPAGTRVKKGDVYVNFLTKELKVYTGTSWELTSSGNSGISGVVGNFDGGFPNSTYGGISSIDANS
jgi:hypothetical protein